jgi:hypothetical protein
LSRLHGIAFLIHDVFHDRYRTPIYAANDSSI